MISAHVASSSSQDWIGTWKTSSAFKPGSVARNTALSEFEQKVDLPIFVCP